MWYVYDDRSSRYASVLRHSFLVCVDAPLTFTWAIAPPSSFHGAWKPLSETSNMQHISTTGQKLCLLLSWSYLTVMFWQNTLHTFIISGPEYQCSFKHRQLFCCLSDCSITFIKCFNCLRSKFWAILRLWLKNDLRDFVSFMHFTKRSTLLISA